VKKDLALADHVLDLLTPLGGVTRRYMFGGWGFYKDGLFFALIADGQFYLKTGPCNEQEFIDAGLAPWKYKTDKGALTMRYHEAPESVLDNASLMAVWARKGLAAAKEAAAKKSRRKPRKR
jgi:DNA transformation protein